MTDDPFDILGLPPRFDLSFEEIEQAYLSHAAANHPDLGVDQSAGGDEAVQAAALNKAKAALSDPERRANALLARVAGPTKENDRSLPSGFLMNIMEVREAVESALAGGDPSERSRWEVWGLEQREEYSRRVRKLFAKVGPAPDPAALGAIRQELNAWRYIERLLEQLDPHYDPAQRDFAD